MKQKRFYGKWFSVFLASTLAFGSGIALMAGSSSVFAQEKAAAKKVATKAKQKVAKKPTKKNGKTEAKASEVSSKVNSSFLSALKFRNIGPALMSGRIGDLAVDPRNPNVWYVAVASGGLWKTTNAGTTFSPIFDSYSSYSIGCVTVDPKNPENIWVGTGENVGGRHVGFGDGIYVSRNGGKSFQNVGLKTSEHISKILVDPRNSDVVYVACQGPLWSKGGERGLYKTVDGGKSWKQVLAKGPYTGVTDVVMDPENPNVLYAATHQRHRTVWGLLNSGPESGIHKTSDGGKTWKQLRSGLPGGDKGKISLGVSPQKNNVVYATVETVGSKGGFYKSENFGVTWARQSDFVSGGTGPHYYQEIYLDPHRFDVIYHANNNMMRSEDGGKTFNSITKRTKHVDNHAVAFHPTDKNFVLIGTDGGLYRSYDYAKSYEHFENLPVTQFYKVDVDYDYPFYHVVGGTQDNNTQYGPVATRNVQGITNEDWIITIGGDGHDNAIDPTNPDIIYCESQQGFISRYDRKTGAAVRIQPQPPKGEASYRFNWDSPILISPHNPKRIYFGSNKLHRSDDQGDSWKTISPDLSQNKNRWKLPYMGRVWGSSAGFDLYAMSQYGNITSVSESPVKEGLIYVGTDDGLVQVTEDGGKNWRKIDQFYGVPKNAFVNDIKADRHDANTVYLCMDNHKEGDFKPYLLKSTDRGRTWKSIANDLPARHLVWRFEQDHKVPNLFFLGTEFGVFTSLNGGKSWIKLSAGMPTISVRDLAIQKRENDLVAASFGRGFFVLDDFSPLREMAKKNLEKEVHIFPVRRSFWYRQADRLGGRKGSRGDQYFIANNPTYGAVFTVYQSKGYKSAAAKRAARDAKAKQAGTDAVMPSWEEIRKERQEVAPKRFLEITDKNGKFVQRISIPASKGLRRVAWNFRRAPFPGSRFGVLAGPGTYFVQAGKEHKGKVEKIGDKVNFEVKAIIDPAIPAQDRKELTAFLEKLAAESNRLSMIQGKLEQAGKEIDAASNMLKGIVGKEALVEQARQLSLKLDPLKRELGGDPLMNEFTVIGKPGASSRLRGALFGAGFSLHGATKTNVQQYKIAVDQIDGIQKALDKFVSGPLKAFKKKLDDQKLPWTTGR